MRYAIRHLTRFDYDSPVRFARCNLRLHPVDWDGQRVEEYALAIDPQTPVLPGRDNGYCVLGERFVLDKRADELSIESRSTIIVDRIAPEARPDDLSVAEASRLAREARDLGRTAPANFLFPSPLIGVFPEIAAWCAQELRPERGVVEAGLALARAIMAGFKYDGSATELDTSPAQAFAARRGVCQDFAQIMISGARSAGLAAAYVSGYLRTIPPPGKARLVGADATHAWVILWCGPERGWLGFDPTNACTVGPDHIVAAIGRDYADVAPIDGVFVGRNGQTIDVSVDVEPLG
ncbi:transglutaminase family protein [Sphingomonas sp. BIUV-7]|uniref:Transglutaminase family protein n=1 Tax=Sphingomonas natans TaxID=3063330 RepID=A0ABT8YEC3_9SPHN|nr:transglutaminase family protein [Sphingomonas sp. BIUV-7]MDO6416693.1 transglutaminase family protein [Sphingomonas sp. BIUV-7]